MCLRLGLRILLREITTPYLGSPQIWILGERWRWHKRKEDGRKGEERKEMEKRGGLA